MLKSYMILKDHQPGPMKAYFPPDERDIVSEVLLSEDGLVIEQVYLTEYEAEERKGRPHIRGRVFEEGYAEVPTEPVFAEAQKVTGAAARKIMGFDALHARGSRGKGQTIFVHDTGITSEQIERLEAQGRFAGAFSTVPGGNGLDDGVNGHGPWCIEAIMAAAPEARIGSVQVLDPKTGSGSSSGIIKGGQIAKREGATINSRSLGGPGNKDDAMSRAINAEREGGISCPCAAGNDQDDKPNRMNADEHHPGCAERAICVAAFDSELVIGRFSSHGNCVDIAAIGVLVEAGGVYMSGTSMATPFVAAMLACLRSVVNDPTAVAAALYAGARDGHYEAFKEGHGFVNGPAALDKLVGAPMPAPTKPAPSPADPSRVPSLSKWRVGQTKSADLPARFRMTDKEYAFDVERVKP